MAQGDCVNAARVLSERLKRINEHIRRFDEARAEFAVRIQAFPARKA